jgi:hypothetical protein
MTPTIGSWQRVTQGPQRGQAGVVDHERAFPTGTYYRLVEPTEKRVIGRFRADQLEATTAPVYVSKVSAETRQAALDLMVRRSS